MKDCTIIILKEEKNAAKGERAKIKQFIALYAAESISILNITYIIEDRVGIPKAKIIIQTLDYL